MAKRIIECQVNDEYVVGSGVVVGAAGSHGDVDLRLTFGDMWIGLNIYATFRDAQGENPTLVAVLPSMLVDGKTMTYDVTIPAAAKKYQGQMILTLTGYSIVDGVEEERATNTAMAFFRVMPSSYAVFDDGTVDATLAQQMQSEIVNFGTSLVEYEYELARLWEKLNEIRKGNLTFEMDEGEGEASIVANDIAYNTARSVFSSAFGSSEESGSYGFKIKSLILDEEKNKATYIIEYHDSTSQLQLSALKRYLEGGEQLTASVIYSNNYDLCGNVIEVNVEYAADKVAITIDNIPQTIKGTGKTLIPESDAYWSPTNSINTIRIFEHPELGNIDIGSGAFSAGLRSKAIAEMAIALGYEAIAAGRCGMAVNRGTLAVWGAFAANEYTKAINLAASSFGRYTQALGEASFSRGITTKAIGHGSDASGNHTEARGGASHTGGDHTIAKEDYQSAIGTYNRDESTAGLIVGNGDASKRSNAFTAGTKDSKAYISIGEAGITINESACADMSTWQCVGDGSAREYYKQSTIGSIITVKIARPISYTSNADVAITNNSTITKLQQHIAWSGWVLMTGGLGEALLIITDENDSSKSSTIRCTASADDNVVAAKPGYEAMGYDRRYCRFTITVSDYTKLPLDSDPRVTYDFSGKRVKMVVKYVPKADPQATVQANWTRWVNIAKA